MANPQKEEGYTAIANEIMDALCRIRDTWRERNASSYINVILRKTYGWKNKPKKKCEDTIAFITLSFVE